MVTAHLVFHWFFLRLQAQHLLPLYSCLFHVLKVISAPSPLPSSPTSDLLQLVYGFCILSSVMVGAMSFNISINHRTSHWRGSICRIQSALCICRFLIHSWLNPQMWTPRIRRDDGTMPFYRRDLSILGFWYLQEFLEPILHGYWRTNVFLTMAVKKEGKLI